MPLDRAPMVSTKGTKVLEIKSFMWVHWFKDILLSFRQEHNKKKICS
jgi:hypothetical protein